MPESTGPRSPITAPHDDAWYRGLEQTLGPAACRQLGLQPVPDNITLSVIIPIYNERATLKALVDEVSRVPIRKELILVDDCSTDGTREILEQIGKQQSDQNSIQVVYHSQNRGKGAAVRTGFSQVSGNVVVIQDADLEYDPNEYLRLIAPILDGRADVVYGSRFLGDRARRVLYFWHYVGNRILTTLSNGFTNLNLTDMETCYKMFRREVVDAILPTLKQDRFGIEPEITAKIARRKYRVYEISIGYHGRTFHEGKKIGWRDGLSAIWCIVRYGLWD